MRAEEDMDYRFTIVVEKDEDGYFAYAPQLQGCYTQGETYEEVMANIKDAIRLHVEDRLANDETVPTSDVISFSTLEVAV